LTLNIRYLSALVCATYCHICPSPEEGVAPVHLDGYTNMYPLLNRFMNNLHVFACQTIIPWERRWTVFMLLAPFGLGLRKQSPVPTSIARLFPIDVTNAYDYGYRSLANNPFGSSPTPFPSIVLSYWLLGVVPDRGSLTKVDTSREVVSAFQYPLSHWLQLYVMSFDCAASTCIRWSEVSSHISCEQEAVGRTAAMFMVL